MGWLNAATTLTLLLGVAICRCSPLEAGDSGLPAPPPQSRDGSIWPKHATMRGLEVLWEVPRDPAAVLLLAHGCGHSAADFWPPSKQCSWCSGLPEEVRVREIALRRGYAVVAVSSFNRTSQCWHNTQPKRSEDLKRLPSVLREVVRAEGHEQLPLRLFGVSSGGGIVLRLAGLMPEVQGVVAQVVPARPELLETEGGWRFPPLLLAHMAEREAGWAQQVAETLGYCRSLGIPAAEIRIAPRPVTPQLLQRAPAVTPALAADIVSALAGAGLLDKGGHLLQDPAATRPLWEAALLPLGLPGELVPGEGPGPLAQLLAVAYARHELTSDSVGLSLAWLEGGGAVSLEELAQQLGQEAPPPAA